MFNQLIHLLTHTKYTVSVKTLNIHCTFFSSSLLEIMKTAFDGSTCNQLQNKSRIMIFHKFIHGFVERICQCVFSDDFVFSPTISCFYPDEQETIIVYATYVICGQQQTVNSSFVQFCCLHKGELNMMKTRKLSQKMDSKRYTIA